MSKSLGVLTLDLIAKMGGFESGMDKAARTADKKLRQIEREAQARAKAIEEAFISIAAKVSAAWAAIDLVNSVKTMSNYADELSKLSARSGIAIAQLSALGYAAGLSGAAVEDLANGLKGLLKKMFEAQAGNGEAAGLFKALGISVVDVTGKLRPAEAVFLDIAEAFSKMEDGAGKSALATKLMEEAGIRLIPTLNEGRAGLEDLRAESEELSKTLEELAPYSVALNDNISRLQTQGQSFAATIGLAPVPALNEVAKELLNVKEKTALFDTAVFAAKTTIETLAILGANVAFVFLGVGREIAAVAAQLVALAQFDFKGFTAIGDAVKEDGREARAKLDAFEQRILNPPKPEEKKPSTPKSPAPSLPKPKLGGSGASVVLHS